MRDIRSKAGAKNTSVLHVPVIIWLLVALLSGLIINGVNVNRINLVFYPLIILCGIGIHRLASRVKLFGVVAAMLFSIAFAGFTMSYFGSHAKVLGQAFYDGFGEAMEYAADIDSDVIYVTNRTQSSNSWWVSEILALYHHQVDALYFQGKADMYSRSGENLPPYNQRYKYVQIETLSIDSSEDAVYIVKNDETGNFNNDMFQIVNFAGYSAVIPVRLIGKEAPDSANPPLPEGGVL